MALILIASLLASVLSGCGLISKLTGGPVVTEETVKYAPGFQEYETNKNYNVLLTQPVTYKKISVATEAKAKIAGTEVEKKEESVGKLEPYNNIFKESAEILAMTRQMKFGLNKIKTGEVKLSVKIDQSMISGGPKGIAEKWNQIVNIDEQTKFGGKVLEAVLKAKDELKGRVEGLTSKIASLKPQEDLKGKEALAVGEVVNGLKQAQSNLTTATTDLEDSLRILADLAK
ncbi:MAG: hypothetical protein NZM06_09185 [Chloroherpetonaceae bacterium]|nr:hypothetical protein [Chloroherpetonaceae bacterium]